MRPLGSGLGGSKPSLRSDARGSASARVSAARPRKAKLGALALALCLIVLASAALLVRVDESDDADAPAPENATSAPPPTTWERAWAADDLPTLEAWFRASTGPRHLSSAEPLQGRIEVVDQASADQLKGRTVDGSVVVSASGVDLSDVRIRGHGDRYLLEVRGGVSDVRLTHIEIDGQGHKNSVGVGGDSWSSVTLSHLSITGVGFDALRLMDRSYYEYIYVHDLWQWDDQIEGRPYDDRRSQETDPHTDGMQAVRGGGAVSRSWVDISGMGENTTATMFLKPDAGAMTSWSIAETYMNGGDYAVQLRAGDFGFEGSPPTLQLLDNRFGRDFRQGLFSYPDVRADDIAWSGNVWADDLTAVPQREGRVDETMLAARDR